MRIWKLKNLGLLLAATLSVGSSLLFLPVAPATAQEILQEQGNLRPAQDDYTFSGTAGQAIAISMTSDEFDTLLTLVGPDNQEIATNDDYARSLNSTIIITLPSTGEYKVQARSFSGMGGNYSLTVRPATPYDQAYSRGMMAYQEGRLDDAIAALNEAIEADPSQPTAYVDRGDAKYAQSSDPADTIADYRRAIELYEQAGNTDMAQMLRDQIMYLQSPPEGMPEGPMPR
jgi:tetratricopeptide (TPR) repeat protein